MTKFPVLWYCLALAMKSSKRVIPSAPEDEQSGVDCAMTMGTWTPFEKDVKVTQCWQCKEYGHRSGDKECPMFLTGKKGVEVFRFSYEDPMHQYLIQEKRKEKEERVRQLKRLLESSSSGDMDSDSENGVRYGRKKKKKRHRINSIKSNLVSNSNINNYKKKKKSKLPELSILGTDHDSKMKKPKDKKGHCASNCNGEVKISRKDKYKDQRYSKNFSSSKSDSDDTIKCTQGHEKREKMKKGHAKRRAAEKEYDQDRMDKRSSEGSKRNKNKKRKSARKDVIRTRSPGEQAAFDVKKDSGSVEFSHLIPNEKGVEVQHDAVTCATGKKNITNDEDCDVLCEDRDAKVAVKKGNSIQNRVKLKSCVVIKTKLDELSGTSSGTVNKVSEVVLENTLRRFRNESLLIHKAKQKEL